MYNEIAINIFQYSVYKPMTNTKVVEQQKIALSKNNKNNMFV